jgi:hypothetical protein
MARRRSRRKKTRRRSPQKFSILGTAEALVVGNALTQGMFSMSILPFLTEGWLTPQTSASNNSYELSLAELVQGSIPGGAGSGIASSHHTQSMTGTVWANIQRQLPATLGTLILAPIAFRMGRRLARKPISMMNKGLKMSGVPIKV